jgi:hypothetical protein
MIAWYRTAFGVFFERDFTLVIVAITMRGLLSVWDGCALYLNLYPDSNKYLIYLAHSEPW